MENPINARLMRRYAALTLHTHTARRSERETIYSEAFRNRCDATRRIRLPGNMGTGRNDGWSYGSVVDATSSAPIAGVVVTVSSPSQTASVTTDASGRFGFLTLAPDTYSVSADEGSIPTHHRAWPNRLRRYGADAYGPHAKTLTTIAHVTSVGTGAL